MSCEPPQWCSPSSLDRYEQCPLAYWMLNIQRLPDAPGQAAVTGTFVHLVLEHLFSLPGAERTLDAARTFAAVDFATFSRQTDFTQLELDDAGVRGFKFRAWELIEQYFNLETPSSVNVAATEMWVHGTIGTAPVRGIIDRLEHNGEATVITDFKTGRVPQQRYVRNKFGAMLIYAILHEAASGVRAEQLRLLYLAGPVEHALPVRESDLSKSTQRVESAWVSITDDCARGQFQATPNRLCEWCVAKPFCPVWGGSIEQGVAIASAARTTTTT